MKALAGSEIILYRRWGVPPRPENEIEIIRRGEYTCIYCLMSKSVHLTTKITEEFNLKPPYKPTFIIISYKQLI